MEHPLKTNTNGSLDPKTAKVSDVWRTVDPKGFQFLDQKIPFSMNPP